MLRYFALLISQLLLFFDKANSIVSTTVLALNTIPKSIISCCVAIGCVVVGIGTDMILFKCVLKYTAATTPTKWKREPKAKPPSLVAKGLDLE